MTDQTIDHYALAAAVRRWPRQHQLAWRRLLEEHPNEALLVAGIAHRFDAYPVTDPLELARDTMPLNPPSIDQTVRAGSLRRAPSEARQLLARMHHDEEHPHAA